MNTQLSILRFQGLVRCEDGPGHGGVTLLGRLAPGTYEANDGPVQLSLVCRERPQLPPEFLDATFEELEPPHVLLRSGATQWQLSCITWQLHRDVGERFYAAIVPRPTPWVRRASWRVLLGVAGTGVGRWLLQRRGRARPS